MLSVRCALQSTQHCYFVMMCTRCARVSVIHEATLSLHVSCLSTPTGCWDQRFPHRVPCSRLPYSPLTPTSTPVVAGDMIRVTLLGSFFLVQREVFRKLSQFFVCDVAMLQSVDPPSSAVCIYQLCCTYFIHPVRCSMPDVLRSYDCVKRCFQSEILGHDSVCFSFLLSSLFLACSDVSDVATFFFSLRKYRLFSQRFFLPGVLTMIL